MSTEEQQPYRDELKAPGPQMLNLCDAFGIERGYHNIWGDYRTLSETTARRLLAAFGVRSDDQTSLELANANIDVAHWQRTLLPVVMHQHGNAPIGISVIIGISGLDVPLHWEISSQSNVRYNGQVDSQHFQRGEQRTLDDSVRVEITIALELSTTLPLGYYRLRIWQDGQTSTETTLIVYPARCMDVPESGNSPRHWGLTVQLYSLRSVRNWGIGDYSDLIRLIDTAADLGAALVGVNPLHALNLHLPPVPNPYSPNSRHFLNVTYLDVEAIDDFSESGFTLTPGQQAALTTLRASEFIDHAGVIALKMTVLKDLFDHFYQHHLASVSERARLFDAFQNCHGDRLRQFAVFEAAKHLGSGGAPGTRVADAIAFSSADAAALDTFVSAHTETVFFFEYLQWQADLQLRACAERAKKRQMPIGLYIDLAVGCTLDSADVWSRPAQFAQGVEIGAPADDFSPDGQCWGTSPLRPDTLAADGYRTFIQLLRDSMRYAGAIRIDHILGLLRLFWVPRDHRPNEGAYVRYPLEHLLAITALESIRNQCVIVGEDLGNVPDEIRHALWQWGILSTRVFYFEKYWQGDQAFKIPEHYPDQALTTIGSHDLPTLRGFWENLDLDIFSSLKRFPSTQFADDRYNERRADRERLLQRMRESHMQIPDLDPEQPLSVEQAADLAVALYAWLARAPSQLLMVQPEDVFGVREQTNVPGTVDEQPNWRRKLPLAIEAWRDDDKLTRLAQLLRKVRPSAP